MPRPSPQTDRVIGVIELLSQDRHGSTMTEIARHLGINQATCVHLMGALTAAGYVVREPDRRYHLGPALVRPGQIAEARYPLLAAARPEMEALSKEFAAPCFAFAPDDDHARLVHATWPVGAERSTVRLGESVPAVPPLGIVFAAWGSDREFDEWLGRAGQLEAPQVDRYRDQRRSVLDLGYVVELAPVDLPEDVLNEVMDDRESPFRDGRLHRLLSEHGGSDHMLTDLPADADRLLVASIGAPVFGSAGEVVLTCTLVTYYEPLAVADIVRIGAAVRLSAARVTAAVDGRHPDGVASS